MADFPYPADYYAILPAWPVKITCKAFTSAKTIEQKALAPFVALTMIYNNTGRRTNFQFWNYTDNTFYRKIYLNI